MGCGFVLKKVTNRSLESYLIKKVKSAGLRLKQNTSVIISARARVFSDWLHFMIST